MSEVLDVDIDEKDEFMEQDDDGDLSKLKSSVRKRKGRGFKESLDARTNEPFESIDEDAPHIEGPQKSVEGWILFVTNVHEEAQEDDVHNMFREYGAIRNMHLNLDRRTGFLKGYALVEYESFKEAQSALEALNGEDLLGQKINVDWAFVKGGATKGNKKRLLSAGGDIYQAAGKRLKADNREYLMFDQYNLKLIKQLIRYSK